MQLLKVSTDKLLLVAGIVWLIAGANIVNIGLSAFLDETGWLFWVKNWNSRIAALMTITVVS